MIKRGRCKVQYYDEWIENPNYLILEEEEIYNNYFKIKEEIEGDIYE